MVKISWLPLRHRSRTYKQLTIVRESPEDYSQDTADLLVAINNKVYRLCERGKAEAALTAR